MNKITARDIFDIFLIALLTAMVFGVVAFLSMSDAKSYVDTSCRDAGQFTVDGTTYRCGVIKEETIQQSKARRFEQCRAWLHNALREPHDPN